MGLQAHKLRLGVVALSMALTVTGCMNNPTRTQYAPVYHNSLSLASDLQAGDEDTQGYTAQGLRLMDDGKLAEATDAFNTALRYNFNNSSLQLLNGVNYHLRAVSGDTSLYKMAEQGYLAAIRFDKSNWVARFYLGMLYMDTHRYKDAKHQFGTYVLQNDTDPEALFYLAAAAYKSGDSVTAHSAATRLWEVSGDITETGIEPRALLRLMGITSAAVNRTDEAGSYIDQYLVEGGDINRSQQLRRRIEDWSHFYSKQDDMAAGSSAEDTMNTMDGEEPQDGGDMMGGYDDDQDGDEFVENKMVAVDVVIIRTEEDISTSTGINLLEGLQMQFGDPLNSVNAWVKSRSNTRDFNFADPTNSGNDLNLSSIVSTISIPAVTYTLNIANEQEGKNEIIARPTLVARAGQTSEFFSGVEVLGAAVSGGAGDSVSIEKEIGVKLGVTPEFGPEGTIVLHVTAERTFLTSPSRSVEFEFRLDTSKTTVDANVAMRFGQTLILSGLNERDVENDVSGVPVIKDVPVANLLFSRRTARNFNKSVIILLTPHPTQYLYDATNGRAVGDVDASATDGLSGLLADRYETWFQPIPSIQRVLNNLKQGELYRYFQSGDIEIDAWYKSGSHKSRLGDAVKGAMVSVSS